MILSQLSFGDRTSEVSPLTFWHTLVSIARLRRGGFSTFGVRCTVANSEPRIPDIDYVFTLPRSDIEPVL